MRLLRRIQRQLECERSAAADALTEHCERAADFLRGEDTSMQAESVSLLLGGKAMGENALHVLRGNPYAVVDDLDLHATFESCDAYGDVLVGAPGGIASIFGVAFEIYENLQHLVLINRNLGHRCEIARQRHAMAGKRG